MVTLKIGNILQVVIHKGLTPISKGRMKAINPLFEEQKANGLIPLTTKSGEVMWVHWISSMISNGIQASLQ